MRPEKVSSTKKEVVFLVKKRKELYLAVLITALNIDAFKEHENQRQT